MIDIHIFFNFYLEMTPKRNQGKNATLKQEDIQEESIVGVMGAKDAVISGANLETTNLPMQKNLLFLWPVNRQNSIF